MAAPEEINADMLSFWNGKGRHTWVARQEHTDITLTPVTDALIAFAALHIGERVVDIGCGCGAPTLEFARETLGRFSQEPSFDGPTRDQGIGKSAAIDGGCSSDNCPLIPGSIDL